MGLRLNNELSSVSCCVPVSAIINLALVFNDKAQCDTAFMRGDVMQTAHQDAVSEAFLKNFRHFLADSTDCV